MGPMLLVKSSAIMNAWVHLQCVLWSPEVGHVALFSVFTLCLPIEMKDASSLTNKFSSFLGQTLDAAIFAREPCLAFWIQITFMTLTGVNVSVSVTCINIIKLMAQSLNQAILYMFIARISRLYMHCADCTHTYYRVCHTSSACAQHLIPWPGRKFGLSSRFTWIKMEMLSVHQRLSGGDACSNVNAAMRKERPWDVTNGHAELLITYHVLARTAAHLR